MQISALDLGLVLMLLFTPSAPNRAAARPAPDHGLGQKQLLAVRGEVTKITAQGKGLVSITVRPAKDYAEVTIIARENDLVGSSAGHEGGTDLFGLLAGDDNREDERITAAELHEGDIVSIIYDPQLQNRALEIYLH